MSQYFFKISQAEKNNILDQHKSIYDGFVTEFGQNSNTQPLYVQDYANDKGGLVVSNKGNVKLYTNMKINESSAHLDQIGDYDWVYYDDYLVMSADFKKLMKREVGPRYGSIGTTDDRTD